jgi:hypothetical protein
VMPLLESYQRSVRHPPTMPRKPLFVDTVSRLLCRSQVTMKAAIKLLIEVIWFWELIGCTVLDVILINLAMSFVAAFICCFAEFFSMFSNCPMQICASLSQFLAIRNQTFTNLPPLKLGLVYFIPQTNSGRIRENIDTLVRLSSNHGR